MKTGFQYRAVQNLPVPVGRRIIKGQIVTLKGAKGQKSAKFKGWTLRRVEAIVDTAGKNDNKRAREVCAGLQSGEIAVFDKAYVD